MEWFSSNWSTLAGITLTTVAAFLAVLVVIRVNGLRTLSKMSSFDFAVTVAIGSLLAGTAVAKSPSLVEGVVALIVLIFCQRAVALARSRFGGVSLIDNKPRILMCGTTMHQDVMTEVRVTADDVRAKLREANVTDMAQVLAVVLETTGDISVLHGRPGAVLDARVMEGVKQPGC